ncbi:hypothetical protein KC342_g78 [Hortaea werneckii]|nr:hypothetical protein KC342_g78 [Hortaea werneckii]
MGRSNATGSVVPTMLSQADRSLRSRSGLAVNQARSQTQAIDGVTSWKSQLMIAFALWMKLRTCMAQVSSIVGSLAQRHLNVCSRPEVPLRNRRSRSRRISHDVIRAGRILIVLIEVEVVTVRLVLLRASSVPSGSSAVYQLKKYSSSFTSGICCLTEERPTEFTQLKRSVVTFAREARTYGSKQCWLPTCRHPDCRSLLCSRSVSPVGNIAPWSLCSSDSDKKSPALRKEQAAHSSLLSAPGVLFVYGAPWVNDKPASTMSSPVLSLLT